MSELDYQRGLRGADCNVSVSDYERWKDWQAGHFEYERQQDEIDDERHMQFLTPQEKADFLKEKISKRQVEQDYEKEYRIRIWKEDKKKAYDKAESDRVFSIFLSVFWLIVFLGAGYIVRWFLGLLTLKIPVIVIWIIAILIAGYSFWQAIDFYKKDIVKIRREYGDKD